MSATCVPIEAKTQVRCLTEYEMSPSYNLLPALVVLIPTRSETETVFLVFVFRYRPIETK